MGSAASISRSASTVRTIVRNSWPRCFAVAASAFLSSVDSLARVAVNRTLPLDSTVRTSVKPVAS
jgi:hypothetical protein